MNALDDQLDVLSHGIRRRLLVDLLEDKPTDGGVTALPVSSDGHDDTDLRTHHIHVPKLKDADYVSVDSTTGSLERGPAFEEIEPLLELLVENEHRLPDSNGAY